MTNDKEHFDKLSEWAENEMELKPDSPTALRGPAAAAHARALMEEAGIGVAELNKLIGGRPALDPEAKPGSHSPKINIRVTEATNTLLKAEAKALGIKPSELVRRALTEWLESHRGETQQTA